MNSDALNSDNRPEPNLPKKLDQHWLPDLCRTEALVWVTLLAVVLAVFLELFLRGANFNVTALGQSALLILWVVLIGCLLTCLVRRVSMRWPLWASVLSVMFGVQLASLLGVWGQVLVTQGSFLEALAPSQLLSLLVGSVALRFFYIRDQERQRGDRLKQAELELLQARIQPHFLFNTLNSIASLITTQPEEAEEAVLDLADLMRSSLSAGKQLVTLSQELDLCEKYLQIERLRMGDRLTWTFDISPEALTQQVPSLSLQPLLENAVLHGVARIPEGGNILLRAKVESGALSLVIQNPISTSPISSGGNKIAQVNVLERLQAHSLEPITSHSTDTNGQYILSIRMVLNG